MRPEILYSLFADTTRLPGVGPRIAKLLETLAGRSVIDLLWHLPSGIIDRRFNPKIAEAPDDVVATLVVTIGEHRPGRSRKQPYRVSAWDETGEMEIVFFNAKADYISQMLPTGTRCAISGKVEHFNNRLQMTHPDHMVPEAEIQSVMQVEPTYPLTHGLTQKTLRKAITAALPEVPELPEWGNKPFLAMRQFPAWREALMAAHAPGSMADIDPSSLARQRLAYDELLANQLALALVRAHQKRRKGRVLKGDGRLRSKAETALPFKLTNTQTVALADIYGDMGAEERMLRMIQGDVGSGKTVVALLAMLNAVECGAQAALMAPTEILARQHMASMQPLAEAASVRMAVLTGRDKGKSRTELLARIAGGEVDIVVGTHALFQETVAFRDLALAVIDEQHRFGVHQRMSLGEKGAAVDTLVMTATPIPRTLTMTAYGDLDVSRLTEKPPGRQPIDTRTIPLGRLSEVAEAVGRTAASGNKAYWVCPLVEESEKLDVAAAEERFQHLSTLYPGRVGLVHGKMKAAEKDEIMDRFKNGPVDILVATTVIEVGVDVPDATVIVIEHAERFGLAQLHQLRGRVGRGSKASTCLLLYGAPLSETGHARLAVMRETEDGFRIAEEDLNLRGAGEILGTKQSGLPTFRLADLAVHDDLLAAARDDARLVLTNDPDLKGERGDALRVLLYLFERDAAIRYLRGG
ncbi:ATP-dependent DNA helicase RecG [Nisaea acidiphila]|uniref:ATP-dependent DNA helicase RecG n=1 Tax=Nisaea acidiphila TaxID=1862145 RepID=A0A9J7AUZ2_9PROT|nr:ATP-dependent DNA helicase RecG [Nisaea acidiphila]UUX50132.1 ATP-dependent DNA helicase RecG [Nisaea acidiphila]